MFSWWRKGKQVAEVEDTQDALSKVFDKLLSRLDDLQDGIDDLGSRINTLENRVAKLASPAEKEHNELVDTKAQLRASSEFMQHLIVQLISEPRTKTEPSEPPKISPQLANYLAKKSANGDAKPKLP